MNELVHQAVRANIRVTARAGPHVLPDVLRRNLDILFCGTAAGTASAAARAYYAGPGNVFWPTLFAVGLTPRPLAPHEFAELIRWNMGLTDLAKHTAGSDRVLARWHFDAGRLRGIIAEQRPQFVAFTGKRAAEEFLGRAVGYGALSEKIGSSRLFVLPSSSGAARRFWDPRHWQELSRLRAGIGALPDLALAGTIASPNPKRL
jgi:TDG/mug DNA glycosylase family protein